MKVLTPGYKYEVQNLQDKSSGQTIQFIENSKETKLTEKGFEDTFIMLSDGTTNEELLEVLIDRIKFLNNKFPCKENSCCITHLEEGLMWLEKRTRDRLKRDVEGKPIA